MVTERDLSLERPRQAPQFPEGGVQISEGSSRRDPLAAYVPPHVLAPRLPRIRSRSSSSSRD